MNCRVIFFSFSTITFMFSCNTKINNKVNEESFISAINFTNNKCLTYSLLGDTTVNNFIDDVTIDNNKMYIVFNHVMNYVYTYKTVSVTLPVI